MSITDAMPKEWRNALKKITFPKDIINNLEFPHVNLANDTDKDVTQVTSKEFYTVFLKQMEGVPSCINALAEKMSLTFTGKEWEYIFTRSTSIVYDTWILDTQYKILHRCYATNSIIYKLAGFLASLA